MASGFNVPTMPELIARIQGDLNAQLSQWGIDSKLPNTFLNVIARVWAGATYLLHKHAEFIARQIIPTLADTTYLERWAALFGLVRSPGAKGTGSTEFSGTPLTAIPAGTLVERADGVQYQTTAAGQLSAVGGLDLIPIEALEYGAAANTSGTTILSLVSPIAGVNDDTECGIVPVTGGLDSETDAALRSRLAQRVANTPQGGAGVDYEIWAKAAIPNVNQVWVTQGEQGAGTVTVRFSMAGTGSAIIPTTTNKNDVQAYIDETDANGNYTRKPLTSDVYIVAPVGNPIDLTVTVNGGGPSSAIQNAVNSELDAMFAAEAEPGGTIRNSLIRQAISRAAGEDYHTLDAVDGGAGAADIVSPANELAYRGMVNYS